MSSAELISIIMQHIRNCTLSKMAHVSYTVQKSFVLHEHIVRSASQCREKSESLTPLLNQQYRLIGSLKNERGDSRNGARLLPAHLCELYQQTGIIQQDLRQTSTELMLYADSFLLSLLKVQHYQWRDYLYLSVLTSRQESNMKQDYSLINWLNAEDSRRYRGLPGFMELTDSCHQMHKASTPLLKKVLRDFEPQELRYQLQAVEESSQRVIAALDCVEERIRLLYP